MKKILLLTLLLTGCTPQSPEQEIAFEAMRMKTFYDAKAENIDYFRDERTGLCFATSFREITYVPCGPEVLALLKN